MATGWEILRAKTSTTVITVTYQERVASSISCRSDLKKTKCKCTQEALKTHILRGGWCPLTGIKMAQLWTVISLTIKWSVESEASVWAHQENKDLCPAHTSHPTLPTLSHGGCCLPCVYQEFSQNQVKIAPICRHLSKPFCTLKLQGIARNSTQAGQSPPE